LASLKPVCIDALWSKSRRDRIEGTCSWVFDGKDARFIDWRDQEQFQTVTLVGDVGCGKTMVMSYIVESLENRMSSQANDEPSTLVCSYSFQQKDTQKNDAASMTRNLLFQLFTQRRSLTQYAFNLSRTYGSLRNVPFRKLWESMLAAIEDNSSVRIYVLLDAIDRCDEPSRSDLLAGIANVNAMKNLKIMLSCKTTNMKALKLPISTIHVHLSDISQNDIEIITKTRISRIREGYPLSEEEQEQLVAKILQKAARCVLWVHLVLESLASSSSGRFKDLDDMIDRVPAGLDQFYIQELRTIRKPEQRQAARALHTLVGAARPLNIAEFRHVLAIERTHKTVEAVEKASQPLSYFGEFVRRLLGPLVHIDESGVSLVHQSLGDFLLQLSQEDLVVKISGMSLEELVDLKALYGCSVEKANSLLSTCCIRYLKLSELQKANFSDQIANFEAHNALKDIALFDDSVKSTVDDFPAQSYYDDNAPFFEYASFYWRTHIDRCPTTQMVMESLQLSKKKSNNVLNWARQYRQNPNILSGSVLFPADDEISSLVIASYFGHSFAITHCLKHSAAVLPSNDDLQRACAWASRMNHTKCLRQLANYSFLETQNRRAKNPEWTLNKCFALRQNVATLMS